MSTLYVNICSKKACMFVRMSNFLLKALGRYPMLYYAVEESLECARIGYYGIGIIAFAQLLNQLNEKKPSSRNKVAHEFLILQPTKSAFDVVVDQFKKAALETSERECRKVGIAADYERRLLKDWALFMKELQKSPLRSDLAVHEMVNQERGES